ncbi:NmrA family transcriptional regulator [Conexibacter sp. SYSU D00693]|uniref:NmrA family transcriptional regulator n=1 Tax=Conexibacter sp. SYSU D00693 TaxID=2812560 RepID=UPI00196AC420|nr:NmrA family transcriptional regulator [Conexibacter sp. SYSU D00693]
MTTTSTITLLGGTGKTGRRIAERLEAAGADVRLGSRRGTPRFDWEDASTFAPAIAGSQALYVAYAPDLAVPGAGEAVAEVARLATEAGVRRLVLLSGRGEEEAQRAEQLVAEHFPGRTVVRCSFFAQGFSESAFAEGIAAGELALPVGDVREPFVDAEDIADVATEALLQDGHAGEVYELTGPRLLSFAEAAAEIGAALGREVGFVTVPLQAYLAELERAGEPAQVGELLGYLFTEVLDGRNARTTDGVQRALGRAPRDFADYARRAAAEGAWD